MYNFVCFVSRCLSWLVFLCIFVFSMSVTAVLYLRSYFLLSVFYSLIFIFLPVFFLSHAPLWFYQYVQYDYGCEFNSLIDFPSLSVQV